MTSKPEGPFLERLRRTGVVAVIRASSSEQAIAISQALFHGGITGIEITSTTPDFSSAIAQVRKELPRALVGAGTVLTPADLDAACEAGAEFLVSPHFDPELLRAAKARGVPFAPGALTPTEILSAFQAGATLVKLFPASAVGPGYVKALRGPLPQIPLMPTGGVDLESLHAWLSAGCVAVGMGGALASGMPTEVEAAARRVAAVLRGGRP